MLPRGLLKEHAYFFSLLLRAVDIAIVMLALWGMHGVWFGQFFILSSRYLAAMAMAGVVALFVLPFFDLYASNRALGLWRYGFRLTEAVCAVFIVLAGIAFLSKTGEQYSRTWFVLSAATALGGLILFRCGMMLLLRLMRARGWNERGVIIIGAGDVANRLHDMLQQKVWIGFRIHHIFTEQPASSAPGASPLPVDLGAWLDAHAGQVDEIWLALATYDEAQVRTLLHQLRHHTVAVRLALDIFNPGIFRPSLTEMGGFPMLNLNATPMFGVNRLIKAIEDRVLASVILLCISPLMLCIAIGVKLASPGPIFFRQVRHGWDGRKIEIWKFRSMYQHVEQAGQITQAVADDHRVTPFGRWLRKTSLDELPQFINVLQGRMSIVGPRPHALAHNELYKESINAYMQRHKVKPGITGWAQVNGWRGETDTLEKMQKRIEYDLYYIEHWSLMFDLKIILLTLLHGFINKNAY